jgi:hypothetical protein
MNILLLGADSATQENAVVNNDSFLLDALFRPSDDAEHSYRDCP